MTQGPPRLYQVCNQRIRWRFVAAAVDEFGRVGAHFKALLHEWAEEKARRERADLERYLLVRGRGDRPGPLYPSRHVRMQELVRDWLVSISWAVGSAHCAGFFSWGAGLIYDS